MTKCQQCENAVVTPTYGWTPKQLQVCSDCWWNELSEEERKQIAQEANK